MSMMTLRAEAKDGEDCTLRVSSASAASDMELPSSRWFPKSRFMVCLSGLGLLVAVLYAGISHQSVAILNKSNVEKTLTLDMAALTSTFYLIKHTFKSKDDIATFWSNAADPDKMKKIVADSAAAGFYGHLYLPTARDGPIFCLWEAQPGKDITDMQKYIDLWTSNFTNFTNDVMIIPSKLTGFPPVNVKPFFGGNVTRHLQHRRKHTSKLYLIQHTFKRKGAYGVFWKKFSEQMSDQDKMKKMILDSADAGFYDQLFLPTALEGPIFCLWEAQPIKDTADMQKYIDIWTSSWTNFTNVVMPIALELIGGFPKSLLPFFD